MRVDVYHIMDLRQNRSNLREISIEENTSFKMDSQFGTNKYEKYQGQRKKTNILFEQNKPANIYI